MKEKMKNRNIALTASLLLAVVLAILVFPTISAATAIVTPVTSGNYTGTVAINVTTDGSNEGDNMTCYYNVTGGNISVSNYLITIVNSSINDTMFDDSAVSISALTDATTYNISCSVFNATGATPQASASVAVVTFDSTNPSCTLTGDHLTIPYKGSIALSWTSSDALSLVSTAVYIDGPQTQTTITDTDANEVRTLTSQDTKYFGDWTVNITGTDRSGNTCIESFNFSSYLPDGVDWVEEPVKSKDTGKIALGIIIVGIVIYLAFIKKK